MPAVLQLGAVLRQRVVARLLDDRGDHRGLRHGQLVDRLAVVRLGRRLDPVGPVTEVDGVQVVGEDPLLGLLLGHLHGHEDLLDLAAHRLLGADAAVVLPDELLGDGRAALLRAVAAGDVLVGGPHDAGGRDAALVEEVPVLGGEHRIDDRRRVLQVGVGHQLAVGVAEPADEGAVLGVDHRLGEAGRLERAGGNRGLLVGHDHRGRAEHDDAADHGEQQADDLAQRPVPPPAALDLDLGPLQATTPRSAESARPTGAARSAGPARPTWAATAYRAAATDRGLGRPEAGRLGVPAHIAGFLRSERTGRRGDDDRQRAWPRPRPAYRAASSGRTAAVPAPADPAGLVPVTEVSSVGVARFRAAETLRVPARGVITQVIVDICGVAPKAPVGRRAAVPRRACVAKPNVKVISFAAHASSLLVARRPPVTGVRPLPEGRAPGVR